VTVEMQFLADVELTCEDCRGTRFRDEILRVKYKGRNIDEVLEMTGPRSPVFFKDVKKLVSRLKMLEDVWPRISEIGSIRRRRYPAARLSA
jgi:excinuclease ABC subunit A